LPELPANVAQAAQHRGGQGTPLVLLHGINCSWRVWRPVLAELEAAHEVLAPTLPGHRGGPSLGDGQAVSLARLADGVERILDEAGIETAHLTGNSLGGWLAVELGRRGRARSVVALSPAGAWLHPRDQRRVIRLLSAGRATLAHGDAWDLPGLIRRPRFRRLAMRAVMEHGDRMPAGEALGFVEDVVGCSAFPGFMDWVRTAQQIGPAADAQRYPVLVAWAEHDRTLPFRRYGAPYLKALPEATHVTLPGVGHLPMFDDSALVAQTILNYTNQAENSAAPV
jgi:pimeloyl-ACP methyl ester carboxylesterase